MGSPSIDIVIVNFRTAGLTVRLAALLARWGRARLFVVDNGSDGQLQAPGATVLPLPENRGFAHAANAGARLGSGDWLLFLNPDIELAFEALDALAGRMNVRAVLGGAAAAGPRSHGPPLPDGSVEWIAGSLLAVPRADFEGVGGFDESYFMYFEDVDLCERLRARGLRCLVLSTVRHVHSGGASYVASGRDKAADYRRSRALYLRRKYGTVAGLFYRLCVAIRAGGSAWRSNPRS